MPAGILKPLRKASVYIIFFPCLCNRVGLIIPSLQAILNLLSITNPGLNPCFKFSNSAVIIFTISPLYVKYAPGLGLMP